MRPRVQRGRSRVRGLALACTLLVVVAAACSGDDSEGAAEPTTTVTVSATTTEPELVPQQVADAAVLTSDDVPDGWEERERRPVDLANPCPAVTIDLTLIEPEGAAPGRSGFAARNPDPGIPAVRQEVYVYDDAQSAQTAFQVRSSGEFALCASATGAEILEATDTVLAGEGFREADPGDLGTESQSWVVSFAIEESGVTVDARFELATFRVGPVVSALLITTSPAFPLSTTERQAVLASAAERVQASLSI